MAGAGVGRGSRRRRSGFKLIEQGGANRLSFPNDFDNAAWTKNNGPIVTANALAAPDGTVTADQVRAGASGASVGVYQAITVNASDGMSIFAKPNTGTVVALVDATTGGAWAQFDISAGTVLGSANCTPTIENYANGWKRITLGAISSAGGFFIVQLLDALAAGNPWAAGTVTINKDVYLWRARLFAPA